MPSIPPLRWPAERCTSAAWTTRMASSSASTPPPASAFGNGRPRHARCRTISTAFPSASVRFRSRSAFARRRRSKAIASISFPTASTWFAWTRPARERSPARPESCGSSTCGRNWACFPAIRANASPLIVGDLLYVTTCNGVDRNTFQDPAREKNRKIPAPHAPNLIVLDKRDGRLVATDDAPIMPNILHGQWSSPSVGVVGRTEAGVLWRRRRALLRL